MFKVAVVGSPGSSEVFRALGAEVFSANDAEEVEELLNKILDDYAVVFITEDIAPPNDRLAILNTQRELPAISLLPVATQQDRGIARLKAAVEKAVGADILGLGGE